MFQDKNGKQRSELIEIKPSSQIMLERGKKISDRDRAAVAVNHAKWKAAAAWCRFRNMTFRVVSEKELFRQ